MAIQFSSVAQSYSTLCNPKGCSMPRPPCPSPTPGVHSNSCPLSPLCHPIILSSVFPFSSCFQSFPASGSFLMSQFFASGGQSIGVSASASVLHYNYISCGDLWSTVIFCVTCWYLRHWLYFSNKFLLLINLFFNWGTTTLQNFVFCETSTRIRLRYSHEQ